MDPEDVNDPHLFGLWDRIFKSDGTPALFFWEVATEGFTQPDGLPAFLKQPVTLNTMDPAFDHSTTKRFTGLDPILAQIDHVTARILIRPLNFALMKSLEQSGDLDPSARAALKTLVSGTGGDAFRTWSRANMQSATGCCAPGHASC